MQQQHHNKLSAQPPPPPGATHPHTACHPSMYNLKQHMNMGQQSMNMNMNNNNNNAYSYHRQSKSGTMTSLTSITATEPPNDRTSNIQNFGANYANQYPLDFQIENHLQQYGAAYMASDKPAQQY